MQASLGKRSDIMCKTLRSHLLWLLVVLGMGLHQSHALCFAPRLQVSDEYFVSDFVITATVLSEKAVPDMEETGGYVGTLYKVHVDRTWRGQSSQSLTIFSEDSTARFSMRPNTTYVLFVTKTSDGKWVVDGCGNSGELASSTGVISALRSLPLQQSFVYGQVISSGLDGFCAHMQLFVKSPEWSGNTTVRADCTFQLDAPPGRYSAMLLHNGAEVFASDFDYKDPYCFDIPRGGSAGIAFRMIDSTDIKGLASVKESAQRYRNYCAKSAGRPQKFAGEYLLTKP